jgi:hypothetical protein
MGPEICNRVNMTVTPRGVSVEAPSGNYTIDADETKVPARTMDAANAACAARGARLCSSDEWNLACVCTYPNESTGGAKLSSNGGLVYRMETEAGEDALRDVRHLLSAASELVAPKIPGGVVLVAGPNDAVSDPFADDCRYRALLTDRALSSAAGDITAVRCCR